MLEKRIAIYIRLSSADEDTGKTKKESNSIVNQRGLIHKFLDNHAELSDYPRVEFVDDGFTGTNMNRPAFQQMISEIRNGKYCCCITKDFSRFARDYIEIGDFVECLFPYLGVRYISVNDKYDSIDYKGTTGGIDVVMQAIIYDAYSKDLSVKIKTGRIQGWKKGRRVGGYPGYGYMRDPNRKAMDIIDPDAAVVVRRIFEAAISGIPIGKIAAMLNRENIPTPGMYFRQKNQGTHKFGKMYAKPRWVYGTVYDILKRYTYTGASVGGMHEQVTIGKRKQVKKDVTDWIIVPNMHDAIITPEEYELAQQVITGKPIPTGNKPPYPLKSLVFCGNCLRRMEKKKSTKKYRCKYGDYDGDENCRLIYSPKEVVLEEIVFNAIKNYIQLVDVNSEKRKQKLREVGHSAVSVQKNITQLQQSIDRLKRHKLHEYERYCTNGISKETYLQNKRVTDEKIARIKNELASIQAQHEVSVTDVQHCYSESERICEIFREEKSLTYDMAHAFVDRILVYPDERIEIQWKFRDLFKDNEVAN